MSEIACHIGRKIKEIREAAGLSQQALAEMVDTTANTVSRWESSTYQPRVEDLDRLARKLGKPIWVFLPSEVEPPRDEQKALLSATGDLPPEDIEELVRYVEFVRARRALKAKKGKN
jgi:transcriptional regulator with XRE-family HTH domain